MLWKLIIALSCVSILAGGFLWIKDGFVLFPHDRDDLRTTVIDPLFGTIKEEINWKSVEPKYGLLPQGTDVSDIPRSYIFVVGASGAFILLGLVMLKRQRKPKA